MFIVGILSWWYTVGWLQQFRALQARLDRTADYFSIDLLARTLFSPFRQISAGRVRGPLGVHIRAFFDKLISRIIGAMVRLTIIVVGGVWLVVSAVLGAAFAILWAAVPAVPVIGILLAMSGWVPWHL